LALLRSVGYVLKNADARSDAALERIVDRKWRELATSIPEPAIFWSFVEQERNTILKEYQINAGVNVTVRPGTNEHNLATGEVRELAPSRPTVYDYLINSGPFRGRDQRDVVAEAIAWWDGYLSDVEYEHGGRDAQQNVGADAPRRHVVCLRKRRAFSARRSTLALAAC
jgi:hypothetical protein